MRTLWNDDWRFAKLPLGSDYPAFQAAEKTSVILPHDFLIGNTDDLYESCDGWYAKTLPGREEYADQCLFLDFDGVYMDADVLLNGQVIHTHRYGYTAFRVELTGRLNAGENEIALGAAVILSTVDESGPREFSAEITRIAKGISSFLSMSAAGFTAFRSLSLPMMMATFFIASSQIPNIFPKACTAITVITMIIAEPTPAALLASVVRFSRSLPPSVNAGIIDQ